MKVDKNGNPVSEGTWGLWHGTSARVDRTFIDPIEDGEGTRKAIAEGAYIVDRGEGGKVLALPGDFESIDDPSVVKDSEGRTIEEGDLIEIDEPPSCGNPVIVKSLYPVGSLKGEHCLSVDDPKRPGTVQGGAPDGAWVVNWDERRTIVKKASESTGSSKKEEETFTSPVGPVKVGDRVRVVRDESEAIGKITRIRSDLGVPSTYFWMIPEEVISGKYLKLGKESPDMYLTRIKEILTEEEGMDPEQEEDMESLEGEQTMATEQKAMSADKRAEKFGKIDVVREGTKIVIPEGMGLRTAIADLQRQAEQEELDVNIMEIIDGYPLDAMHAFLKAMEKKFGWVDALPTPGFFGPTPPTMIGIQVDPDGRTVQVPWGTLGIPGITGQLKTGIQFKDGWPVFCIQGTIKQKDKTKVNEIAQMAREYLKENSIYKGKAIRVKFPEDPKGFSPLDHQPKFIHTADIRPEELIFSEAVEKRIRVNIWTPIQANTAVRAAKVPLKRGVLLHGRYGVGKTLLSLVTARLSVQAGITFIDLEDSRQLPQAIRFARGFGGMVVIFAEDIDRCDENGTRTDAFNEILNTVDGLTSKTDEILVVYTTNHIEKISKAMLRQGRIDKVIHIPEPNAEAVERLIRLYARHMLDKDENIRAVAASIAEMKMIPAAIREIVEQSKLAAIERGDVHHITSDDLAVTVEDTKEHNELLKDVPKDDRSELERMGDALGARIGKELASVVTESILNSTSFQEDQEITDEPVTEAIQEEVRRRTRRAA